MADRLPAGEVLNEAFQFGLNKWVRLIQYGWLPIVISIAVLSAVSISIFDVGQISAIDPDTGEYSLDTILKVSPGAAIVMMIAAVLFLSLLYSGVLASVYRLAALGEDRKGIFQLRLDGPAIRVFWTFIIKGVIDLLIFSLAFFVAAIAVGLSPAALLSDLVEFILFIASGAEIEQFVVEGSALNAGKMFSLFSLMAAFAIIPKIYVSIRLAPLSAGSAAENRILLFGSFNLTRGSFWPIFVAHLLLILFLIVAGVMFQLVTLLLQILMQLASLGSAILAFIGIAAIVAYFALNIFFQLFTIAATNGLQAIIYRRLRENSR